MKLMLTTAVKGGRLVTFNPTCIVAVYQDLKHDRDQCMVTTVDGEYYSVLGTYAEVVERWQQCLSQDNRAVYEADERVKQIEAQLAAAREALSILEAAPGVMRLDGMDDEQQSLVTQLIWAVDKAHNTLDDALEWPSDKAQALLDGMAILRNCAASCPVPVKDKVEEVVARWKH